MNFQTRHINRLKFPQRHVIVAEDDLDNQIMAGAAMRRRFEAQGEVVFDFVSGGIAAASIMSNHPANLLLLDHDMPIGNGSDLIEWMAENKSTTPIITFSGIPENNDNMFRLASDKGLEVYRFMKFDVIAGWADQKMWEILSR